jgi:hypothetical protein
MVVRAPLVGTTCVELLRAVHAQSVGKSKRRRRFRRLLTAPTMMGTRMSHRCRRWADCHARDVACRLLVCQLGRCALRALCKRRGDRPCLMGHSTRPPMNAHRADTTFAQRYLARPVRSAESYPCLEAWRCRIQRLTRPRAHCAPAARETCSLTNYHHELRGRWCFAEALRCCC